MNTLILILLICIGAAAFLYMLMIMPKLRKNRSADSLKKWLYAHRGLHDNSSDAPENSLRAFAKAVEAGYGIEMDIQLSKDKIPVVFHDFTLQRICGPQGKVSDYTFEELQQFCLCGSREKIPRFEDVLKLVDGRVPLIVEFKIELTDLTLCPIADELLRSYQGEYCIESFNPLGVLWYRRNRKEVMRGQLSDCFLREGEYRGLLYFVLQHLLFNFVTKPDFVAYNHKYPNMLSRKICRRMYRNLAVAWTIKSEEELAAAKKNFDIFIFDSFVPAKGGERTPAK